MTRTPTPMRNDVAVEAWRRMRELTHRPDVLARARAVAEEAGVTPALAKALLFLSADHPVPMRGIAHALRCDSSYVTAVVDGLEERGLARREPHPTDRRVKVVEITPDGVALAERFGAALDDPPGSFDALEAAEVSELLRLLRKLDDQATAGAGAVSARTTDV